MHVIHCFRRDLRLTDNPALRWACEQADTLSLVFIHDPESEAPWEPGGASRWWLHHSLLELQSVLEKQGQTLILRRGPTAKVLAELIAEEKADAVSWNRLYEPAAIQRDKAIKSELQAQGLSVHTANSQLLLEPWTVQNGSGAPYRVFTPFWKQARRQLQPGTPWSAPTLPAAARDAAAAGKIDDLALLDKHPWHEKLQQHWSPGESGALKALKQFQEQALGAYDRDRDRPDRPGTSRLSPHLHWGEIGPAQILAELGPERLDSGFVTELGWREFAHHLLFHFPHTSDDVFNPKFQDFPWDDTPKTLAAWQRGETGIDMVDAGMHELWETGWMHNRLRMIVGSLLTKNLNQPWWQGARWFWDCLVDANLASNSLGWQWIAGCGADAAPYFRVFNPDTQAEKFDPDGRYRERWLSQARPSPCVDLKRSRAEALARYARHRDSLASGDQ